MRRHLMKQTKFWLLTAGQLLTDVDLLFKYDTAAGINLKADYVLKSPKKLHSSYLNFEFIY